MRKVASVLIFNLLLVFTAYAQCNDHGWKSTIDTLSPIMVGGLKVVPMKIQHNHQSSGRSRLTWRLEVLDYEKNLQKFEGVGQLEKEPREWFELRDQIFECDFPQELKDLTKLYKNHDSPNFMAYLCFDQKGRVFTVFYSITDDVYQKLESLPQNFLKKLHSALLKKRCEAIEKIKRLERRSSIDGKAYGRELKNGYVILMVSSLQYGFKQELEQFLEEQKQKVK